MTIKSTLRLSAVAKSFIKFRACSLCCVQRSISTSNVRKTERNNETGGFRNHRPRDENDINSNKPPTVRYLNDQGRRPSQIELEKQYRPNVEPGKTSVLLFPGQGSQFLGMGKALLQYPGVEDIYAEASEILKYDILDICLNGPQSKLDRTLFCQPAVFVTSIAATKKLIVEYPESLDHIAAIAGFSIGEITALVMGGVLSFPDAVQLIKLRALAMQDASEAEPGGMMTVFLGADSKLRTALMASREFCRRKMDISEPVCDIAIHLSKLVKVIAGHEPALEFIKKYGKEWEIKDIKPLPVCGAFHTPMMRGEVNYMRFKRYLEKIPVEKPSCAIWSNSDECLYSSSMAKKFIFSNYLKPVRWEQIMHKIYTRPPDMDFPRTYEIGPGKQLGWVVHKINKKASRKYTNIEV